jgi:beta-1,6-galactosyltransferase
LSKYVLVATSSFPTTLRRIVALAPARQPWSLPLDLARLHATLLRLAVVDLSEASLRRDVDDLLEGRLLASTTRARAWHRDSHLVHPLHLHRHQFPHHRRGNYPDLDHDPCSSRSHAWSSSTSTHPTIDEDERWSCWAA